MWLTSNPVSNLCAAWNASFRAVMLSGLGGGLKARRFPAGVTSPCFRRFRFRENPVGRLIADSVQERRAATANEWAIAGMTLAHGHGPVLRIRRCTPPASHQRAAA